MGVLVSRPSKHRPLFDDVVFFEKEGEVRSVSLAMISFYEFAYCLSVHKSQGSEFKSVLLAVPEGSENFGKELLYTGATRSKEKLHVVAKKEILEKTIKNKHEIKLNLF